MHNNWLKESGIALSAVSAASEFLISAPPLIASSQKETLRDLVTNFDIQAQNIILQKLASTQCPVLAEENYDEKVGFDCKQSEPFWVVDSIDGTVNFIYGIPLYASTVGLCYGNQLIVGAVSLPALNELYFTHGELGAYINGNKVKLQLDHDFNNSLFGCAFSSQKSSSMRQQEYLLFGELNDNSRGCLRIGAAATAICFVVSQRLDCAYGLNVKLWDIGGAIAVAQKAGLFAYVNIKNACAVDFIVGSENTVKQVLDMMNQKKLIV